MEWWQRLKKKDQEYLRLFTRFREGLAVLSEITTWQSLRSIGSSRILSLTIAVPFVGYLIIFNDNLIEYTKIARQLISDGTVASVYDQTSISLSNLYYLYFGLVLTGLGSLLFALFCPIDIRQSGNINEYSQRYEQIKSATLVSAHLDDVMTAFSNGMRQQEEDDTAVINIRAYLTYPKQISSLHYNLVHRIFEEHPSLYGEDEPNIAIEPDNPEKADNPNGVSESTEYDYDPVARFPLHQGADYLDVESVTNVIVSNPGVFRSFVMEIRKASAGFFKDICLLRYQILDHSKPYFRIGIGLLYLCGFVLLFIPTLKTLHLVLSALTSA